METQHQDKLLSRVRKALALAADEGATDGERDAAIAAAQRIMLEHGLEMSQVEEVERDDPVGQHDLDGVLNTQESDLLWAVASASFCKGWRYSKRNTHRWVLIGRPEHVAYARELYAYISMQAQREVTYNISRLDKRRQYARMFVQRINYYENDLFLNNDSPAEDWKRGMLFAKIALRKAEDSAQLIADTCEIAWNYGAEVRAFVNRMDIAPAIVENLGIYKRTFYTMYANRVHERLLDLQDEAVSDMETGTALVKNEWAAVEKWWDENAPEMKKTEATERKWSRQGEADGREAGDRADISTRNKVENNPAELTA